MLATTIAALLYQANNFFRSEQLLLGTVATILLVLSAFVIVESSKIIRKRLSSSPQI